MARAGSGKRAGASDPQDDTLETPLTRAAAEESLPERELDVAALLAAVGDAEDVFPGVPLS
jgi:hypothetical protein